MMTKRAAEASFEETQAALHEGIERAKALVQEYEERLRPEIVAEENRRPNPAA